MMQFDRFKIPRAGLFAATLILSLSAAGVSHAAETPEVLVELDRTRIYEGESVRYQVLVNHVENPEAPTLPTIKNMEVTPLGSQSLNSRSITVINGQRSEVVRLGQVFNYGLTPKKAGTFLIPAPKAKVAGKWIYGQPVTLEVVAPQEQDAVRLELEADRTAVYPLQPFRVTLKVLVKSLPAPLEARNPLSVQRMPPGLEMPWVPDEKLPKGIVPETPWNRWLEALHSGEGGFSVNNVTSQSVFSLFEENYTTFMPRPRKVTRRDKSGGESEYWEFAFERTFTGQKIGDYTFGPAILRGRFATEAVEGRLVGEDMYLVAKAIDVQVKDVPPAGRPASYIGAVGQFQVRSLLTPTDAKVGDPLTLTIEIAGQGALDEALPPKLEAIPAIADHFRIYEATSATEGLVRKFTYSLRPKDTSLKEFPAVPISFYDVDAEKYVTRETEPIPITIGAAQQLSGQEIAVASPGSKASDPALEQRVEGVFANDASLTTLQNQAIDPQRWAIGVAGLIGFYALAAVTIQRIRTHQADPQALRRRGARQAAEKRIEEARGEILKHNWRGAADHLRQAVVGLVADAGQLSHAGLTSADVLAQLRTLGLPNDLIEQVGRLLEACDGARYGGSEDSLKELAHDAGELVARLTDAFRERKWLR